MPWDLVGLEKPAGLLSNLIKAGRLPHALLFIGPAGVGKNSLALALAASLNCAGPDPDASPCGHCPSCRKIARDIHPDLTTLTPGGEEAKPEDNSEKDAPRAKRQIKIQEIRELRRVMAYRPFEGRVKVFILREADRLGWEAAAALLKTLEEPPPDSALFLTSAAEGQVLPTIRSRCLTLRLNPLPLETVLEALAEKRGLAGPEARLLAALSGGALGMALAGDSEAVWGRWQALNRILGAGGPAESLALAWSWVGAEDRAGWSETLDLLRLWWRETLRLAALGPDGLEGPPPQPAQRLWAGRLTPSVQKRVARAMDRLADSLERLPQKAELFWGNYWLSIFQPGPS
jgi:DNA polymerase-3 subunit delta'